ncbi:SIS domain-containing protein [Pelagibacterium montanilacus]|uniref:SIS domain-containing protein n=1 Tax=Pelagibacterium montanilacus TaxID=2185280 RepID=UPI000F8ECD94|nr:SIS domain-containing protein [Pelagibacterium montanilacus]
MDENDGTVLGEIMATARSIPFSETARLAAAIGSAPRIYIHGLGRCGHVMKMFSIRLAQLGLPVQLVGEPTALAAREGDLLVVGSGTGETRGTVSIAEKAVGFGLDMIALSATEESTLARLGSDPIILPGVSKLDAAAAARSIQPPGSLFEQMLFCFLEQTVVEIARTRDPGYADVRRQHANLE